MRCLQYEESDVVKAMTVPANVIIVTDIINKYLRQKDALVAFRDDLDDYLLNVVKFPTTTETVKVDGKDVVERNEKPGQYLDRLVAALVKGEFTHPKLPVSGADPKAKEASVYKALQAIADTLGDTDSNGKPVTVDPTTKAESAPRFSYILDISRPERVSKPKTPPDYAIEGATQIINNKAESKWAEKFKTGFKDAKGIQIDPIVHEPFNVVALKGATAEVVESTRKANILALAWAIAAKEQQVREKTKTEKLAEFN